jgi:hypothetical protein
MSKKFWMKGAVLLAAGGFALSAIGGGCLAAVIQRILVAVTFD